MGHTNITVDEFLKLSVGDVVTLDNKFSDPVNVYVNEKYIIIGKPGVVGKNMGVQILDIIDKDVENYE